MYKSFHKHSYLKDRSSVPKLEPHISIPLMSWGVPACDDKGRDLFEIVKEIDSKMLFPIQTKHPEMFVRVTRKMTVVEAKSYLL